jgi:hypothetical protein
VSPSRRTRSIAALAPREIAVLRLQVENVESWTGRWSGSRTYSRTWRRKQSPTVAFGTRSPYSLTRSSASCRTLPRYVP